MDMNIFKKIFSNKKTDEDAKIYDKGLEKTRKDLTSKLTLLGKKYNKVTDEYYDELENILINADIGINTVEDFMIRLKIE
jgi:fused signal recognition particle receptor